MHILCDTLKVDHYCWAPLLGFSRLRRIGIMNLPSHPTFVLEPPSGSERPVNQFSGRSSILWCLVTAETHLICCSTFLKKANVPALGPTSLSAMRSHAARKRLTLQLRCNFSVMCLPACYVTALRMRHNLLSTPPSSLQSGDERNRVPPPSRRRSS